MDKVIKDGVDVSECARFIEENHYCELGGTCDGSDDCYYKQLQRLKAENERLKKDKIGLHSEIKQLEQENFELKESLKCFQTPEAIKALTFYKTGEFDLQEKRCIKLEQENARLKQTLQEIKEIAEELSCKHPEDCWENKPDWNGEVYGCDVADNWKEPSELATCPSKLASAILQLITKAEEE